MKHEEIPSGAVDAAVRAELVAIAASKNARFALVAGELYEKTLILICARAKVQGFEAADLLEALVRLFSALDGAAGAEAARLRAERVAAAAAHGKN